MMEVSRGLAKMPRDTDNFQSPEAVEPLEEAQKVGNLVQSVCIIPTTLLVQHSGVRREEGFT